MQEDCTLLRYYSLEDALLLAYPEIRDELPDRKNK